MPKLPIDYSKSFIYKLCCKDKNIEECYIGSSTNWIQRKYIHKSRCNNENGIYYIQKKYKFIRKNGGWDNWEMILIHNYPCNTSQELRREEERVRQEYNKNLNSQRAYLTKEQFKKEQKEYNTNYYKINNNKIKNNSKKYRDSNKDKVNEKITCECGSVVYKRYLKKHRETIKHKNLLKSNEL